MVCNSSQNHLITYIPVSHLNYNPFSMLQQLRRRLPSLYPPACQRNHFTWREFFSFQRLLFNLLSGKKKFDWQPKENITKIIIPLNLIAKLWIWAFSPYSFNVPEWHIVTTLQGKQHEKHHLNRFLLPVASFLNLLPEYFITEWGGSTIH